jgi:hypothetical protein
VLLRAERQDARFVPVRVFADAKTSYRSVPTFSLGGADPSSP